MRRPGSLLGSGAIMVVVALAYGCTPAPRVCTEIGSPAGIFVTVERDVAATVDAEPALVLRICQTECAQQSVALQPGSVTVGETCAAGDPDGSCSASASPDGTLVGFADVTTLSTGGVRVSGTWRTGSGTTALDEVDTTAEPTYPNGPSCPAGGPQAAIRVTPAGLR